MLELVEIERDSVSLDIFRDLLTEYQALLGVDLCFQGFDKEVANPLHKYTPPRGIVLLGYWNSPEAEAQRLRLDDAQIKDHWLDNVCACGALQDLGDNICELKRIYVRPSFRRRGIARSISEYLLKRAQEKGYERARLDTLRRLEGAIPLYQSLGFSEIEPYNFNPEADIVYMEKLLAK